MSDGNPNVITTWYSQRGRRSYHTDICRAVWLIDEKRYLSEAEAQRRGYEECVYCAGEYETSNGDHSVYHRLQELSAEEVLGE